MSVGSSTRQNYPDFRLYVRCGLIHHEALLANQARPTTGRPPHQGQRWLHLYVPLLFTNGGRVLQRTLDFKGARIVRQGLLFIVLIRENKKF